MIQFATAVLVIVFSLGSSAGAQWLKDGKNELPSPLVDSEPFDLLILNDRGEEATLKIKPMETVPTFPLDARGVVVFELFADFDEKLEVPNASVEKIETFQELLLAEARSWVSDGKYRMAFRNLLYLYDNGGDVDPDLVATMRKCMFFDATDNLKQQDFERALSTYEDIYLSDPDIDLKGTDKSLIDIIMICYDGIIQQKFDAQQYSTVQKNVDALASKYPDEAEALVDTWNKRFLSRSDELLAQAREYASQNEGRLAHQFARKADQVVPDRKAVLDYQTELLNQFPLVMVGVSQTAADFDPTRIDHWGSRRTGRLVRRRMVELSGLTDEGGQYNFLNGTLLRTDEVGLKYSFEIENSDKFGIPPIDAFELSTRLISRGQPDSPNFNGGWAKVVDRVFVEDDSRVSFTLKTPFVRPESLLTMPYSDVQTNDEGSLPKEIFDGHYVLANRDRDITTFETNPIYDAIAGEGHPVIIEQLYATASEAVDDLMAGNIDVVDRIAIGDIKRLKADPKIGVRPYALPTVHLLVPKIRDKELGEDLFFRTGLSHLIDRNLIVNEVICGGNEIDGCLPISGPFPIGTENNDQISYGYDMSAKPIPYNESLGRVLTELAMAPKPPKRTSKLTAPSMTIVYPPSSMAANACNAIARNWTQAGFPTETRVLKDGQSIPEDPNWDFLYIEVTMEEPLTDAHKLVGNRGIAKNVSAPIEQTLRILNYSRSWQSSCAALRRLHRQIRVDLSVIPLWQITEHYAFRNTARNLGRELVHLYQNVDRWKIDPSANEEQED